jgi:hypothetical protein
VDFIDEAIEKKRNRRSSEIAKQNITSEEAEKLDLEIREKVDQLFSEIVFPVVNRAKIRFEEKGFKAEIDIEKSMSLNTERNYHKGVKLLLNKGLDKRSGAAIVIGPTLYFYASPPYSTTVAIVAYGADNSPIFSERFEITEMTEEVVVDHIKMFVEEVIK